MTTPDKLMSIEEAERAALMGMGGNTFDNICALARQLADVMRENERLLDILRISRERFVLLHKGSTLASAEVGARDIDHALEPYKESGNE